MLMQHKMHFGRRSPHQPNPQQNYYLRQRKAQQQRPVPDQVAASCHALDHVTASSQCTSKTNAIASGASTSPTSKGRERSARSIVFRTLPHRSRFCTRLSLKSRPQRKSPSRRFWLLQFYPAPLFCRRRHQPRRPAQAKNAPLKSLAQTGDLYRYMTKVLAPAFD
jgi:hypothetical protein